MTVTLVIPVIDNHELTQRALESFRSFADNKKLSVLLIDNASEKPYTVEDYPGTKIIRNEKNAGMLGSLQQAVDAYATETKDTDILVYTHNDVLVWEQGWDTRIQTAFDTDKDLGIAGFFGAPVAFPDGGRGYPQSNMQGKEWGSPGHLHGHIQTGTVPAAILDGLCMIFRRSALEQVGIPPGLPHHFYDKALPLHFIDNGWRCAVIGIAFDHQGGMTSTRPRYNKLATDWCEENGVEVKDNNPDNAIYLLSEQWYLLNWADRLPLFVDSEYHYFWNDATQWRKYKEQ